MNFVYTDFPKKRKGLRLKKEFLLKVSFAILLLFEKLCERDFFLISVAWRPLSIKMKNYIKNGELFLIILSKKCFNMKFLFTL